MSQDDPQYDCRVQAWNLRKGLMNEDQLKEYLRKLPDVKDKADHLGSPTSSEKPGEAPSGKSKSR
ncbi:MAG: hypothetical protein JXB32_21115 [Deltaproteobacteria bacterium]|nr:hypothetical protein [Deltaproteobacteria bacterium]